MSVYHNWLGRTALAGFQRALVSALGGAGLFQPAKRYRRRIALRLTGLPSRLDSSAATLRVP